jgi:hypothetical protein
VVTKGNRIVGQVHSLDAVRGLTTSYGFLFVVKKTNWT